ncbi:MAG: hypothetical protein ACTID3_08645 [Halomonas sp.]|uniref:hypothetical protein n=1 Tax=Halomonas sp. TaxID=1486246 RepID=UPI003F91AF8A
MNSNIAELYAEFNEQSRKAQEAYRTYRNEQDKADAAKYAWLNGAAAASGDDSQPYGEDPGKQYAAFH